MKALDMVSAEDNVVSSTRMIVPGMIVAGMEAVEAAGYVRSESSAKPKLVLVKRIAGSLVGFFEKL
jgi:hypothetical protein